MQFTLLTLTVFAANALAQSSTTCGSDYYSQSQVSGALNQGYNYYEDGQTVGSDSYPHQFDNYSGFDFKVSGPYYEFPITESGLYSGGSPGADRVIFNGNGQYAGAITHTGAKTYDDFVGCSGTS